MSNNAPIGAFDSGVGGLSILSEIRQLLPAEDLIYLADTAHCPYGIKPVEEIRARILKITDFLVGLGVKAVVVACNSASVAGLDQIRKAHPEIPIIGVEPAVKPAHDQTKNGKIGVLATSLTLSGSRFSVLVEKYGNDVEVYTQPAPGLVELVEAGKLETSETESILKDYLEPLLKKEVDTLVLGCTHYPFLKPLITKIVGAEVAIIDTGLAVAKQTRRILDNKGLKNDKNEIGNEVFYTSGKPVYVKKVIENLWLSNNVNVLKADI